jgi:ketosteroid isomerase-like protein
MTRFKLTSDVHRHPQMFAAAFNDGDPDVVYEEAGLLIAAPGVVTTGSARRKANARLAAMGVPIEVRPRHVYVAGDIALLVVDWSIVGTACGGEQVDVRGTATDVARRGVDGYWRYVIDNPFGVA